VPKSQNHEREVTNWVGELVELWDKRGCTEGQPLRGGVGEIIGLASDRFKGWPLGHLWTGFSGGACHISDTG
jgi:hypothetical protein